MRQTMRQADFYAQKTTMIFRRYNLSSRKILTYKIDITKVEDITEEFRVWINGSDSGRILG